VKQPARSPYELTAGSALDDLHPVLRRYLGAIPAGHRGYGSGVFEAAGTPRRWLRPLVALVSSWTGLFPVWETNVPFTVVNAPMTDREGRTAVVAVRRFHFSRGVQTMVDAITAENPGRDGLTDHLGLDRRFRIRLRSTVLRGELHLDSTAVEVRIGRQHFRLPGALAPRLALVERYDDAARGGEGAQRVTVTVVAPVVGLLYQYTGAFTYEVRPEVVDAADAAPEGVEPRDASTTRPAE